MELRKIIILLKDRLRVRLQMKTDQLILSHVELVLTNLHTGSAPPLVRISGRHYQT
jgi:hypothetical protein